MALSSKLLARPVQMCGAVADAPPLTPPATPCSPTYNPVNLVQFNGVINGLAAANKVFFQPTMFAYFLHSSWHCCSLQGANPSCNMTFSPINTFFVNVGASYTASPQTSMEVRVYTGPPANTAGVIIFDAQYLPPAGQMWHVLVSVNCNTQVVQVYVNDQLMTPISGGWTGSGLMPNNEIISGGIVALDIGANGVAYPAVADIWEQSSNTSWVDLSVVSNRRRFINADLSPASMGPNGETPFGVSPPIFLTAKTGPNDLATNYGTGGSFGINLAGGPGNLTMQTPGLCSCPT